MRRIGQVSHKEEGDWHELATRSEELGVARVALLSDFARRHGLSLSEATRRLKIKAHEAVII
ncbi:hypothetical protein IAD21_00969 [Abditibacteriota bacterium]|nr:hypothetical protein IAD21_00969 [Abditibacteriota bacterium]